MQLETSRLRLRVWRPTDGDAFAALNSDPEVMADEGGPIDRASSDAKLVRYAAAFERHGIGRWLVEDRDGGFLGYAGVMPSPPSHPLGEHVESGWRLLRTAWGRGYATEAARAALDDALGRAGLPEVLAYTAADNLRSRAVMERLGLRRDPARDFTADYPRQKGWRGLVWVARRG
ncbi:MAG: GNAT family N-acetyltransferase [Reyranellaceae bacterium]